LRLFATVRRQTQADFGLPVRWHSVYGPSFGLGRLARRSLRRFKLPTPGLASAWSKGARSVPLVAALLAASGLLLALAILLSLGYL
jgi:hypothetical protein